MASLSNIKKKNTRQAVIEALQNFIVEKRLQPGDSVPTEHELSAQLGVSRSIIREALQHFSVLGIIESRPKRGARIKQLVPENPYEGYLPYLSSQEKLHELLQMRMIVELGAVPFVVKSITDKQIESLLSLAEQMQSAAYEKRKDLDTQFHSLYLRVPANSFLASTHHLVIDYFKEHASVFPKKQRSGRRIMQQHVSIVEGLQRRDEHLVYDAITEHYSSYKKMTSTKKD